LFFPRDIQLIIPAEFSIGERIGKKMHEVKKVDLKKMQLNFKSVIKCGKDVWIQHQLLL